MLNGVEKVLPGYAGGAKEDATYQKVSSGKTGHAEVIYIEYDEKKISYCDLLTVFFASHDPTIMNRQGDDVGTQYRSVIFYTSEAQKVDSEKFIAEINASNPQGASVVTELELLKEFFEAEKYHKDYYTNNKDMPYCQVIINPKLDKVQKQFANLLNQNGK